MIVGIGIDTIEIARFTSWHRKPMHQLKRVLSESEISYCLQDIHKSAQRFAIRFAVREALYKAISQAAPTHTIPLLTLCKAVTLTLINLAPDLHIDWGLFAPYIEQKQLLLLKKTMKHCSLSHNRTQAIALVILEKS